MDTDEKMMRFLQHCDDAKLWAVAGQQFDEDIILGSAAKTWWNSASQKYKYERLKHLRDNGRWEQ